MLFSDKGISCIDCRQIFIWTAGEQEYWQKQPGFTPPKRCKKCRALKWGRKEPPPQAEENVRQRKAVDLYGYIDQDAIVEFVQKVEDTKGFKRDVRLVFAHIVEEVGELSKAIWMNELAAQTGTIDAETRDVAKELIDIIFLSAYLADILAMRLNEVIPERMGEIRQQYGVTK